MLNLTINLKNGFQLKYRGLQRLVIEENKIMLIEAYTSEPFAGDMEWDRHTFDTLFLKDIADIDLKLTE